MKLQRYRSQLADLSRRVRLTGAIAVLLAFANVLLAVKVASMEGGRRNWFLPPTVTKEFWVRGDSASPEYLEMMATYVASLALTYNPSNFRGRTTRLLRYVAPASHAELESRFTKEADDVERYRVASVFHVQQALVRGRRVALLGQLDRRTGSKAMESRRAAFLVEFVDTGDSLLVTQFKEVDYDDPFLDRVQPDAAAGDD